jgi:transposase
MTRRRYELTDHEWSILSPLLPNKPAGFLGSMIGEC